MSLHDVAPSKAELCRRWLDLLERRDVRASLLVVPGVWNGQSLDDSPHFITWLREAEERGHEIVMHGYHHVADSSFRSSTRREVMGRVLARGCQEFWNLPFSEAKRRLHMGREALLRHGFTPKGFVAPGWLMSPHTYLALKVEGFSYTTTHCEIVDLASMQREKFVALSQRPQSMVTKLGIALNNAASTLITARRIDFRLAIHPNDLVNQRVRESNISIVNKALSSGYSAITYQEKIAEFESQRFPTEKHTL